MRRRLGHAERLFLAAASLIVTVCSAKDVVWCTSGRNDYAVCSLAAGQLGSANLNLRLICDNGGSSESCMARMGNGTAHVSVFKKKRNGALEVPLCGQCKAKEWSFCLSDNVKKNRVRSSLEVDVTEKFGLWGQEVVDESWGMLVSEGICHDGRSREGSPLSSFCKSWECVQKGLGVGLATRSAVVSGSTNVTAENCTEIYRSLRLLCDDGLCEKVTESSRCWKRHLLQDTVLVHNGLSIRQLSHILVALWPPVTPSAEAVDANMCLLRTSALVSVCTDSSGQNPETQGHTLPLASTRRRRRLAQAPSPSVDNSAGVLDTASPDVKAPPPVVVDTKANSPAEPAPALDEPPINNKALPNGVGTQAQPPAESSPTQAAAVPVPTVPPPTQSAPLPEAPSTPLIVSPPAPVIETPPPDNPSPPITSPLPPASTPPTGEPPLAPVSQPNPPPPPAKTPATTPTFEPSPPQATPLPQPESPAAPAPTLVKFPPPGPQAPLTPPAGAPPLTPPAGDPPTVPSPTGSPPSPEGAQPLPAPNPTSSLALPRPPSDGPTSSPNIAPSTNTPTPVGTPNRINIAPQPSPNTRGPNISRTMQTPLEPVMSPVASPTPAVAGEPPTPTPGTGRPAPIAPTPSDAPDSPTPERPTAMAPQPAAPPSIIIPRLSAPVPVSAPTPDTPPTLVPPALPPPITAPSPDVSPPAPAPAIASRPPPPPPAKIIISIPPVEPPIVAPSQPPPASPPPPLLIIPPATPPDVAVVPPPPSPIILPPPPPDNRNCPACPSGKALKPIPEPGSGIVPPADALNCICTLPMRVFITLPMELKEFVDLNFNMKFLTTLSETLHIPPDKAQLQGVAVRQRTTMRQLLYSVYAAPTMSAVEVETWLVPMASPGDRLNSSNVERITRLLSSSKFSLEGFPGAVVSLILKPGQLPPSPPPSLVPVGASPSGSINSPPTNKVDDRSVASKGGISSAKLTVILSVAGVCVLLFVVVAALFAIRHRRQRKNRRVVQERGVGGGARKSHTSSRGSRQSRGSQQGFAAGPFGPGSYKAPSLSALSISSLDSGKTGQGARAFTFDELARATNNFDDANILGQGGFGMVYRGRLDNGWHVAVKILKGEPDSQTDKEFVSEIEVLGRLHHRNLVRLLGMCSDGNARCLIYELVHSGSLEAHLHGAEYRLAPLDWEARVRIALGAARGLCYLHEGASPRIIHRDFKASNILLEKDFNAKVSDFGLAKQAVDGRTHVSTRVMGTFGYVAPEYAMTGHLLVKSDVYSFGVVLLELLTGRKPVDLSQRPGQENLVTWARPLLLSESGLHELMDPSIPEYPHDNALRMAELAAKCVHPEVTHRPVMSEVVQELEQVYHDLGLSDTTSLHNAPVGVGVEYTGYTSIPPSQDLQHFPIPPAPGSARSSGPQQFRAGSSNPSEEQLDVLGGPGYTPKSLLPGNRSSAPVSNSTPKSGPLRTLRQWGERAMDGINGVLRSSNPPAAPVPVRAPPVSRAGYGLGSSRREENSGELEYDPRWR